MKAFIYFFRGWLGLYFVLIHFVVPFYLVAIYPDIPVPAVRLMHGFGYGVVHGQASELGFWLRFLGCGAWVVLGFLILCRRLRDFSSESVKGRRERMGKNGARRAT